MVGIVPGKLENREEAIAQIAELLETTPEAIEKMLSAQWVKDDSFVPIKTVPRVEEIKLMKIEPDEEVLKEKERHEKLLEIPGPSKKHCYNGCQDERDDTLFLFHHVATEEKLVSGLHCEPETVKEEMHQITFVCFFTTEKLTLCQYYFFPCDFFHYT